MRPAISRAHIRRPLRKTADARRASKLLLSLLGIGLMVGGAMSGGDTARELGGAGQGVMVGGESMVIRSFLLKRRSQEAAADQAGFEYLDDHQAVGPRHARDLRALRRATTLGSYGDPYMQQPSGRGDAHSPAAGYGREKPLRQRP